MGDWVSLDAALDRRGADGGTPLAFWWRDDDLDEPSEALDRLLAVRRQAAIPLSLAVIPATARTALRELLDPEEEVTVLQHGYDHRNHAKPGEKKAELAAGRGRVGLVAQLTEGRRRLEGLFPVQFRPVLVPPWNRIAPDVVPLLHPAGYVGLSTYAGSKRPAAAPGLIRADCHIDIVDWRGGRGFLGTEACLALAVKAVESGAPAVGLLTHHLVVDRAGWDFVDTFVIHIRAHLAARWVGIDDAMIAAG
jgi:hypothetical protein